MRLEKIKDSRLRNARNCFRRLLLESLESRSMFASVSENALPGTLVGIDGPIEGASYALANDAGGRFRIEQNTGVVSVANGDRLDYEQTTSHAITVAVYVDSNVSFFPYLITLDDVDEFDAEPVLDIDARPNFVNENSPGGTEVGVVASSVDRDGTTNKITYQLLDDAGGRFQIDPMTGSITVANNANIDFEQATSLSIVVRAESEDESTSDSTFVISVGNVVENNNESVLFKAILAMDSYNRMGDGLALQGSKIGNSEILHSKKENLFGFFASAYELPSGDITISYRGTDAPFADDIYAGWAGAVGLPIQAYYAESFASSFDENINFVGHSLGGGLAGYMAATTGGSAVVFDSMPFSRAVGLKVILEFFSLEPDYTGIRSIATAGEFLTVFRNSLDLQAPYTTTSLESSSNLGPLDLHSQALLVSLVFEEEERNANRLTGDWKVVGPELTDAMFSNEVAMAAGVDDTGLVFNNSAARMQSMIAYSAIDDGQLIFGDTGIRAMFKDADEIGKVLASNSALASIPDAKALISKGIVQFAGALADNKVQRNAAPKAADGIVGVNPNGTTVAIDYSKGRWDQGKPASIVLGKKELIDGILATNNFSDISDGMSWLWGSNATDYIDRIEFPVTNGPVNSTLLEREFLSVHPSLFVATDGADFIKGTDGHEIIFGGGGQDTILASSGQTENANNFLAGGDGDDRMFGGKSRDYFSGGEGNDTVFYSLAGTPLVVYLSVKPSQLLEVNAGDGNIDRLAQVEKIELSLLDDAVNLANAETMPPLIVDGGSGDDRLYLPAGKSIKIEEVSSDTPKKLSNLSTLSIAQIERLEATNTNDSAQIRLVPDEGYSAVREIHMNGGDDELNVTGGGTPLVVYLGSGNDVLEHVVSGSTVYGDSGADTFNVANNYLIADASPEDRITSNGVKTLTGGVRWKQSDSPWAYGAAYQGAVKYGINRGGELVIQDFFGNKTFVANFNNSLNGPYTAGIKLVELDLKSYKLVEAPDGWKFYETMEALLGHAMKALTGYSLFNTVDPLVLDLDGDGIELNARTSVSPMFDLDSDGFSEMTGWVRPDDAFLVRDINRNGIVDGAHELIGNANESGFEVLMTYDLNSDGVVEFQESDAAQLFLWQDLNANGATDAGELKSLYQMGINKISVAPIATDDQIVSGNTITDRGIYERLDGTVRDVGNVHFAMNNRDSAWLGDSSISNTAILQPEIKGYGTLPNLRIAMTLDPSLETVVANSIPLMNSPNLQDLRTAMSPVLKGWIESVPLGSGQPGADQKPDVHILAGTTIESGAEVFDFAFRKTDSLGSFWALGSGRAIHGADGTTIDRPTLEELLAEPQSSGAWTTISGKQIQFVERRLGTELPLGNDNSLDGEAAISAAKTLLDYIWQDLNKVAVRIAVQGSFSQVFQGIRYDLDSDAFIPTSNRQLAPMLESLLRAAPQDTNAATAYLDSWKPFLDVFLKDFQRGSDYLIPSYGFLFQQLLGAYENTNTSISLTEAAKALGIPDELLQLSSVEMTGSADADIFHLRQGTRTASGGIGPDVYVVGKEFGAVTISDIEPAPAEGDYDMLRFSHWNESDLTFKRSGVDLVIGLKGTDDKIVIASQFSSQRPALFGGYIDPDYGVREVVFADGSVMDKLDMAKAVSWSSPGDDDLAGSTSIDVLDGGGGNDTLSGGDDGDYYVFGKGYGHDTIQEKMNYILLDSPDVLRFNESVTFDDTIFSRLAGSDDLRISIKSTGDTIDILGQFAATYTGPFGTQWLSRIEVFGFADGTTVQWDEVFDLILADSSTPGDDTIVGFSNEDTMDGGPGNDFLSGGNENDLYIVGFGYGIDTIEDKQTNILSGGIDSIQFAFPILPNDVSVSRVKDSNDLLLQLTDGTQVIVRDQFRVIDTGPFGLQAFSEIESMRFYDGTVWTTDQIAQRLLDQNSTMFSDQIFGFYRDDILIGNQGDDYLDGGNQADTYIFNLGDGHDTISDSGSILFATDGDKILFGDGISPEGVTIFRPAESPNDALLVIASTGDSVLIKDQFFYTSINFKPNQIESIQFADGTIWDPNKLRELFLLQQTTIGDDNIIGFWTDDLIEGSSGNDDLQGGDGSDTYLFDKGFGRDVIQESVSIVSYSDFDSIQFKSGIAPTDVVLIRDKMDLILEIRNSNDRLLIVDQFKHGAWFPGWNDIERIVFSDGTTWNERDLRTAILSKLITSGDDTIDGFWTDDVLSGGAGNDLLRGAGGGDTYLFGLGSGKDVIEDQFTSVFEDFPDELNFGDGVSVSSLILRKMGDDLLIRISGTRDQVTIKGQFASAGIVGTIETFRLTDGTVLDNDQILAMISRQSFQHNAENPLDVNADGIITPSDALLVINILNSRASGGVSFEYYENAIVFADVNQDQRVSPDDALMVVNKLNSRSIAEGEGETTEFWFQFSSIDYDVDSTNQLKRRRGQV